MRNAALVWGKVAWSETLEPVKGVAVQLFAVQGALLASAQTDAKGGYEATVGVEALAQSRGLYLVVTEADGRVLCSTQNTPAALQASSCQFDVLVPERLQNAGRETWTVAKAGPVDLELSSVEDATPEAVLAIARSLVGRGAPTAPLLGGSRRLASALSTTAIERSLCGTPVLEAIEELIRTKGWPREVAHEVDDILAMRNLGFDTATYESAHFIVTYQTSGPAAVPSSTASEDVLDPGTTTVLATIGNDETPTYVLRICFWLERALAVYVQPPFSMKDPAAAGKIPVVINTSPYGSASPSGTFYMNNALAADLICAVGVHELFHMVQFQYGGSGLWRQSVLEGGAVFAEDMAADKLNRYLDEAGANFNGVGTQTNPNLCLATAGYKCCLFWRYVAEQHSPDVTEPFIGVETYRTVLEHCAAGSFSTADVKSALRELPWYQDFYEFSYVDPERLDLSNGETTLGNYALACILKDLGTNIPDNRFDFIEDEENITIDEVVGGPPSATLASVTLAGTTAILPATATAFNGTVNSFAHRYYEAVVDPRVTNIQISYNAGGELTSGLFQIALIDDAGMVRDIHRTDKTSYTKRVTNLIGDRRLAKLIMIVTGAESGGAFSLTAAAAPPAPDVMVTRWNSIAGTEHEIDSRNWAWTWVSPDLWVDNNRDGITDCQVFFHHDNRLNVRLRNKGNADASNVRIELYYQDASGGLSPTGWKPVRNKAGIPQVLTGLALPAGATSVFVARWSPAPSGRSEHFCLRAVVMVPNDPNTDNKRALSSFGKVRVKPRGSKDLRILVPRWYGRTHSSIQAVPRLGPNPDLRIATRDVHGAQLVADSDLLPAIRVSHVPSVARVVDETGGPRSVLGRVPDPTRSYETEVRALPPGLAGKPLVTLVELENGKVRGGVTLLVEVE